MAIRGRAERRLAPWEARRVKGAAIVVVLVADELEERGQGVESGHCVRVSVSPLEQKSLMSSGARSIFDYSLLSHDSSSIKKFWTSQTIDCHQEMISR